MLASRSGRTSAAAVTAHSRLLSEALERVLADGVSRITVLDLGPGNTATAAFFGALAEERRVNLLFVDVEELRLPEPTDDAPLDHDTLTALWREHLALPASARLDVLLLWDYLHYLDIASVEALSSVLQPHLTPASRGYGFGSLRPDQKLTARRYGVGASDVVSFAARSDAAVPHAHSQKRLDTSFTCMYLARCTLLQEGHLELLFKT